MVYHLNETELNQLNVWCPQLFKYYSEADTLLIENIVIRALSNGYLDADDIYELIELLPRIIPENSDRQNDKQEDHIENGYGYMDEQKARYKREMGRLRQTLSSWIFLQSAVYRKNMQSVGNLLAEVSKKEKNKGISIITLRKGEVIHGKCKREKSCLCAENKGQQFWSEQGCKTEPVLLKQ